MVSGFAGGLGKAVATFDANMRPFISKISGGIAALDNFDKRSARVGIGFNDIAKNAGVASGAIFAGLAVAAKGFIGFEQGIANVGAVSSATADELEQLSDLAIDIGKQTKFGATEATGALEELAKAGVSVKDILNGAAEGATDLAAAAGGPLADAATVIATTLNTFELAGTDATHVADIFAAASNKSAASIDTLALGLQQSANLAHQFGISVEENVAALALFADRGLKGSDAGTSFRTMLLSMLDPTEEQAQTMTELGISFFDATGQFIGLGNVAQMLQERLGGLNQEERNTALAILFGSDAVRAANILYTAGEEGIRDYTKSVNDAGAAQRMADARMNTTAGALERLRSSAEAAQIEFGANLAPAIRATAELMTRAIDAFSGIDNEQKKLITTTLALGAGFLGIVAVGAKLISIGSSTVKTWQSLAKAFKGAQAGCAASVGCMNSAGTAASAAGANTTTLIGNLKNLAKISASAIVITVAADLIFTKSGQDAFDSFSANVVNQIGEGLDAAGLNELGDKIKQNVEEEVRSAKVEDIAIDLGFTINRGAGEGIASGINDFLQEGTDAFLPRGLEVDQFTEDDKIVELGVTFGDVAERAKSMGISVEEALSIIATEVGKTTPEIEAWRKSQVDSAKAAEEQARAARGSATATRLQAEATEHAHDVASSAKVPLEQVTNSFEKMRRAAVTAFTGIQGEDEITKEIERIDDAVSGFIAGGLEDLGAATNRLDLSHPFEFLQRQLQPTSNTIAALTAKMGRMDILNLSKSDQEALKLASALERTDQALERTQDNIDNNNEDIAMWSARQAFLDETLGENINTLAEYEQQLADGTITQEEFNDAVASGDAHVAYAKLQELVDSGRISQEEANDVKEDAIWLEERIAGALLDEREEQLKNVSALRDYVELHDKQSAQIKELTTDQRALLAAMQDESALQALQIVQTLAYLAALGLIPPEKVTEFVNNAAQQNPIIATLFEQIGLLDTTVTTTIDADTDKASKKVKDLDEDVRKSRDLVAENNPSFDIDTSEAVVKLDTLNDKVRIIVGPEEGPVIHIGVDDEDDAIAFIEANREALKDQEVVFVIAGDDGDYQKTMAEVEADTPDPKTVVVTADTTAVDQAIDDLNNRGKTAVGDGTEVPAGDATATLPPATQPVVADTTQAKADVETLRTDIENPVAGPAKLPVSAGEVTTPDLGPQGEASAQSFTDAFVDTAALAVDGLQHVFNQMVLSAEANQQFLKAGGAIAADAFTQGVTETLSENTSVVYKYAYDMATAVYTATLSALQIHSPSALAEGALKFFVEGAALGITNNADIAVDAARNAALAISTGFRDGLDISRMPAFALGGIGDDVEQALRRNDINIGGGSTTIVNNNGDKKIDVNGSGNPERVATYVFDLLNEMDDLHTAQRAR
jgi:TP901 family phage tail tape measure protein